ncbi:MAG TPA: hypothetical protein VKA02_06080 [Candidatus Acidoferrum sp.]|nr:hypothetical protein [Candidatus Acidoferrum sp.]
MSCGLRRTVPDIKLVSKPHLTPDEFIEIITDCGAMSFCEAILLGELEICTDKSLSL